jgi:hypothetical protein
MFTMLTIYGFGKDKIDMGSLTGNLRTALLLPFGDFSSSFKALYKTMKAFLLYKEKVQSYLKKSFLITVTLYAILSIFPNIFKEFPAGNETSL